MNQISSLILSFLLLTFIPNLPSSNAASDFFEVLDSDGNPLTHGNEYFIFPADAGAYSGGINLGKAANSKCPLNVVQNNYELGRTVKFTVSESTTSDILTGEELEIHFSEKPACAESSEWFLFVDKTTQLRYVGLDGPENYDVEKIHGKFLITEYGSENSYSLKFCFDDTDECAPLGLKEYDEKEGVSQLILVSVDDFPVEFIKDDGPLYSVPGDKISNMR